MQGRGLILLLLLVLLLRRRGFQSVDVLLPRRQRSFIDVQRLDLELLWIPERDLGCYPHLSLQPCLKKSRGRCLRILLGGGLLKIFLQKNVVWLWKNCVEVERRKESVDATIASRSL